MSEASPTDLIAYLRRLSARADESDGYDVGIPNAEREALAQVSATLESQQTEIENLRRVLRLALNETKGDFHAGDLEWVQQARSLLRGSAT